MAIGNSGMGYAGPGKAQHIGIVTHEHARFSQGKCDVLVISGAQKSGRLTIADIDPPPAQAHDDRVRNIFICMESHGVAGPPSRETSGVRAAPLSSI